jgi:hypothetical protein
MARPTFGQLHFVDRDELSAAGQEHTTELKTFFETADSLDAAGAAVTEVLDKKLSTSLAIPLMDIDIARPTHFHGVPFELRKWFAKELASDVAAFDLL